MKDLSLKKILPIAWNTFRESVRDRVLYVIFFFAVMMMLASHGVGWVSVGQEAAIVQHFSLAVVSLFGALIAVFVGTGLIYKEIDKRTIYTILSKPVHRYEFLLGKFFGLEAVLFCVLVGMGAIACLAVGYAGGEVQGIYIAALLLIFFELTVLTSIAIFFGTVTSPILAAIFTFCTYLIGQVTRDLARLVELELPSESVAAQTGEHLTDVVSATAWFWKPFAKFFYYLLPDLSHFHLRNRVVYGPPIDWGSFYLDGEVALAIGYGIGYACAVLLLSIFIFSRSRF